jgi:hypothetical protein
MPNVPDSVHSVRTNRPLASPTVGVIPRGASSWGRCFSRFGNVEVLFEAVYVQTPPS